MARSLNFAAAAALALAAAAGAQAARERSLIVSEQDLSQSWRLSPSTAVLVADYPATASDKTEDACVNIAFKVLADGSPAEPLLLRAWSSQAISPADTEKRTGAFAQNATALVERWKFVPAGAPKEVYTSATIVFRGSFATPESIRAHCAIPDLKCFLADDRKCALRKETKRRAREEVDPSSRY